MSMTLPLRGAASTPLVRAQAWARQRGAVRLQEVDAYLAEVWRLGTQLGYDPAAIAAQSSRETNAWTAPAWRDRLNPAGIGIREDADAGIMFRSGTDAARAHLVHLSAFATGYETRLREFIALDPEWQSVFEAGHAGSVRTVADLSGRWSPDPIYGERIIDHLRGIQDSIRRPNPAVVEGGIVTAPVHAVETGNWGHRMFDQEPVAIVYHRSGDRSLKNVLGWMQNPISRSSVHAAIDLDGAIHLLVDADRAAWSNGDIKNPRRDIPWLNEAMAKCGPMSLNDFTLAIELIGTADEPPTEAQYRSTMELSGRWRDRYGIAPHRGRLLRHSDINSVERFDCPGPAFDLARVIEALGGFPAELAP